MPALLRLEPGAAPSKRGRRQGGGETEVKRSLWIEQTELFDLFQQHRGGVFRWLQAHPAEASEVMEGVIRVLTFTG